MSGTGAAEAAPLEVDIDTDEDDEDEGGMSRGSASVTRRGSMMFSNLLRGSHTLSLVDFLLIGLNDPCAPNLDPKTL